MIRININCVVMCFVKQKACRRRSGTIYAKYFNLPKSWRHAIQNVSQSLSSLASLWHIVLTPAVQRRLNSCKRSFDQCFHICVQIHCLSFCLFLCVTQLLLTISSLILYKLFVEFVLIWTCSMSLERSTPIS